MALRQRLPRYFDPYQAPTSPPPGTYDPGLDAQLRAAQRGYGDLQTDYGYDAAGNPIGTQSSRSLNDFTLAQQRLNDQGQQSIGDVLRARARGQQDYATQTANVGRQYGNLATQQGSALTGAGVTGPGGALAAALRVRTANQGRDQAGLDLQQQRFLQDSGLQESRIGTSLAQRLGDLGTGYQRGVEDNATKLERAARELGFYGQDVAAQRFAQASSSGLWDPMAGFSGQAPPHAQAGSVGMDAYPVRRIRPHF